MKKTLTIIIGSSIIASLFIIPLLTVKAETEKENWDGRNIPTPSLYQIKLLTKDKIENRIVRASTTENRLENRENNIERIIARIASTTSSSTASTSKRLEKLDNRLQKQEEQMSKIKDRLINKELKITQVLGKIATKIQDRINILAGRGLDMTAANAKLAEANAKISEIITEADKLATLASTTITTANQVQLFTDIKASQDKIKSLAFAAHSLLVDTIKEITKVLPRNNEDKNATTSTSTATTTN